MSSILDTASLYNTYSQQLSTAGTSSMFSGYFQSSGVLGTSSSLGDYSQSVSDVSAATLQTSLGAIGENSSDEELLSACKSFESYFVQQMIETAKSSIVGEEEDGEYMKYFGDILNEQYANAITESGGIGLAQQLYEAMKTTYHL